MIIEGKPLEQADAVMAYCIANKVACLYYDLRTYNGLDATKKATVTAYYKDIVDEYVLDLSLIHISEPTRPERIAFSVV